MTHSSKVNERTRLCRSEWSRLCQPLEHPVALVALVALVGNDHWLKHQHGGWISGKLSDVAGLVLLPLWLEVILRAGQIAARLRLQQKGEAERALLLVRMSMLRAPTVRAAAIAIAVAAFAAMQLSEVANGAFAWGLGVAQWPLRALISWLNAGHVPALHPVVSIADAEDLLAVPAVYLLRWVPVASAISDGRVRRHAAWPRLTRFRLSALPRLWSAALFVALSLVAGSVSAGPPQFDKPAPNPRRCPLDARRERVNDFCHDGFFLAGEAGVGWVWMRSPFSISNGFRQELESTADGSAPNFAWYIGGASRAGLVFGGRIGSMIVQSRSVATLGQAFAFRDLSLVFTEAGPFVTYYVDPGGGTFLRGGVNFTGLALTSSEVRNDEHGSRFGDVFGVTFAASGGYEVWLARQLGLGLSTTLRYFRSLEPRGIVAVGPSISATLTWQ